MNLTASLVVIALFGCVISMSGHDHDCKTVHGGSKQYGYGSNYKARNSQFGYGSYYKTRNPGMVGRSIGSLRDTPTQPLPPYSGCFSNEGQGMLQGAYLPNERMHIRLCVSHCNRGLYRLLGVHNTSCYCGNSYDPDLHVTVPDSECNIVCPGNASQHCGGDMRLSVYRLRQ